MTDVAIHQPHGLAIAADQTTFTSEQRAILAHMGVEDAPEPDLRVFMHVCQRSGLDPFARQIHMIGRNSRNQKTDQWETKYTIQTGIDGYRLIGRRAADRASVTISIGQPEWAHEDGTWRPVWSKAWGSPVAARVTIERDGKPFTAVALFDEYVQTKRDGKPTSMWATRPAGQLAKCAEALAWRMAFPQDLSGIYTDDEMGQADRHEAGPAAPAPTATPTVTPTAADFGVGTEAGDVQLAEEAAPDDEPRITQAQQRRLFMLFKAKGIPEHEQRGFLEQGLQRLVTSRTAITPKEYELTTNHLETLPDKAVPRRTDRDNAYAELTHEAGKRGVTDAQLRAMLEQETAQPVADLDAAQLQAALEALRQTPVQP